MKKIFFLFISFLGFFLYSCKNEISEPEAQIYVWKVSTPGQQGVNSKILDSAFIRAQELRYVDGFLIIKNGYLITERYYNGYSEVTPHNVKSVSKSFLSAMIGIALDKGIIKSIDEKVLNYFPEYVSQGMDNRKNNITIKHLLTMRMGIDIEENNYFQILASKNWTKSTLELPLLSAPGEKFRYNTFETHLLSAILTKTSKMSLMKFGEIFLTNPMGIKIHGWTVDPQGYYFGGNDMYFTPREIAVLGYLYLNKGRLNGIQIVPEDWVNISLSKTWDKDAKEWGVLKNYNYGYLWWLGKINEYDIFWALGFAGQMVVTFPALNLIIVSTANYDNVGWDEDQERPILEIISKYVLPAVTN